MRATRPRKPPGSGARWPAEVPCAQRGELSVGALDDVEVVVGETDAVGIGGHPRRGGPHPLRDRDVVDAEQPRDPVGEFPRRRPQLASAQGIVDPRSAREAAGVLRSHERVVPVSAPDQRPRRQGRSDVVDSSFGAVEVSCALPRRTGPARSPWKDRAAEHDAVHPRCAAGGMGFRYGLLRRTAQDACPRNALPHGRRRGLGGVPLELHAVVDLREEPDVAGGALEQAQVPRSPSSREVPRADSHGV